MRLLGWLFVAAAGGFVAYRIQRQKKIDAATHDPLGIELDKDT